MKIMKNLKIKTLFAIAALSFGLMSCGSTKSTASSGNAATKRISSNSEATTKSKTDTKTTASTSTTKKTNVKLEPGNVKAVQPKMTKKQLNAIKQQQISVVK